MIKLLVLTSLMLISGCLNYYQEVKLYPDGSGYMHIDYWMKILGKERKIVIDDITIQGVVVEIDEQTGTAQSIELFKRVLSKEESKINANN